MGHRGAIAIVALVVALAAVFSLILFDRQRLAAQAPSSPTPTPSPVPDTRASEPGSRAVRPQAALLLPNMRSLEPSALQIDTSDGARRLRFAASLANVGPGPLLLLPRGRTGCPSGQGPAQQVVHQDANRDGRFQRTGDRPLQRRDVGCMLRHPWHKHWHFDAMAAYALRRPGTAAPLVARNKVSFCLRDNARVPGQRATVLRQHFGRCSRTSQQGISPGWVDIYKADLDGQWLRVPAGVDNQTLCLDLRADPRGLLVETDETDNGTSVAIRIVGDDVDRVDPAPCR